MTTAEALARLRKRALSITPQRRAILRYLEGNTTHPTAHDIFVAVTRDLPVASRATVYNSLGVFRELGIVREVGSHHGEVRYDMNADPHHHYRCRRCRTLIDLPTARVRVALDQDPTDTFLVDGVEITFEGTCPACRDAGSTRGEHASA